MTGDHSRAGLTLLGRYIPRDVTRLLNGATNFLDTGRRLHDRHLTVPRRVKSRFQLFDIAIADMRSALPLYLEFGVYRGKTIRYWADHLTTETARFIGFDSFEGLPEHWNDGATCGHFDTAGESPTIDDHRISFVKGLFNDSLSTFLLPKHDRLFVNVDSDLYASASTVLRWLSPYLRSGDFLYFDEFHDRLNEGRAFCEFYDQGSHHLRVVGGTKSLMQILFQVSE